MSADGDGSSPDFRFLRAIWELDHALESASRGMKRTFGVTGRERLFIRLVGQHPGVAPGALADTLHVHPSSITAVLKRLERRRLVTRRPSAEDGRSFGLALTPSGAKVNAMKDGTIEAGVRDALADVNPAAIRAATELVVAVARRLGARPAATRPAAKRRRG